MLLRLVLAIKHSELFLSKIYESNYGPISKNIKSDIDMWSQLPLDMHNRMETIKINLLPRLLYLLSNLMNGISGYQDSFGQVGDQEFNLKRCNWLK